MVVPILVESVKDVLGMWPFAWVSLQILAVFTASVTAWLRTSAARDRYLRVAFACALPFTAVGALLLDYGLRFAHYAATGFAGPAPTFGGIMAYGALFGLACALYVAVRVLAKNRGREEAARGLDRVAPAFGILVFVGRLGCLLEGCEHGGTTSVPWAIRYSATNPRFATLVEQGLAREGASWSFGLHPTPLYEGLVALLAAALATFVPRRHWRPGAAFATAAAAYAIGRFAVEGLDGNLERGAAGPLTAGQAMSLVVVCLVVSWCARQTASDAQAKSSVRDR